MSLFYIALFTRLLMMRMSNEGGNRQGMTRRNVVDIYNNETSTIIRNNYKFQKFEEHGKF